MSMIDPTARVADGAVIGDGVSIGPYCVVGPDVKIGEGVRLMSHVNVDGDTVIGPRTIVHPFASLGTAPQSLSYRGEPTRLEIGADCQIRESVTMNRGTVGGGGITRVGDRGYFMAYSHVAHDCHIGNNVIFANSATVGGHCTIGDHVFIGGLTGIHQFTRIGAQAMISGACGIAADVIPFVIVDGGFRAQIRGLNVVGLRRRGFTPARLRALRSFCNELFFGPGVFADRLAAAAIAPPVDPGVTEILDFIRAGKRPLAMPRGFGVDADDTAS